MRVEKTAIRVAKKQFVKDLKRSFIVEKQVIS